MTIPLSNPSPYVVRVSGLCKSFGKDMAVDHLDFDMRAGSIMALLGVNGAGKTTTLSMLMGLTLPDQGLIEIFGQDMARHTKNALARMNFSSPYVSLPGRLTVRENLTSYGYLYDLPDVKGRIEELTEELQLAPLLNKRVGGLSAGQATRVQIAKALINRPELLLLDEPTASLDPDTADWTRDRLRHYNQNQGVSIILASHNMAEVEQMCDDVLIMDRGRLAARGTPAGLCEAYGQDRLEQVFLDIARKRGLSLQNADMVP